jgi:hypothetical protein
MVTMKNRQQQLDNSGLPLPISGVACCVALTQCPSSASQFGFCAGSWSRCACCSGWACFGKACKCLFQFSACRCPTRTEGVRLNFLSPSHSSFLPSLDVIPALLCVCVWLHIVCWCLSVCECKWCLLQSQLAIPSTTAQTTYYCAVSWCVRMRFETRLNSSKMKCCCAHHERHSTFQLGAVHPVSFVCSGPLILIWQCTVAEPLPENDDANERAEGPRKVCFGHHDIFRNSLSTVRQ